jgi:4-amino-4-deoxy-L-arabinose transferase-like glycosyltransferase
LPSVAERWGLFLAVLFLCLGLHGLDASDIVGDDEAREVGIVQDVVAGHVLWPRFNASVLPDKPILSHWVSALPVMTGGFSETNVRLPGVLAGAAVVGWTVVLGTALWDLPSGIAAGLLLTTMPGWFNHMRVCRPDALLVLFLSIGLGVAYNWWRTGQARDAVAALTCVGLATFTKGPVGTALFVIAFGGFLIWQRSVNRVRDFLSWRGVVAFTVLGLGWYVIALGGWGEVFVREHLIGRYVRNLTGGLAQGHEYSRRPLWYHLSFYPTHLLAIALPWTPFALATLWRVGRRGGLADPRIRFLLCWILAPVVAFTPAEWKLRYYLLPSLPAVALLAGPTIVDLFRERALRRRPPPLISTIGGFAVGLVLATLTTAVTGWVLLHPEWLSESDRTVLADVTGALGGPEQLQRVVGTMAGVTAAVLALRAWPTVVSCLAAIGFFCIWSIVPIADHTRSQRDSFKPFATAVAARVRPEQPLVFWSDVVRSVVVYAGRPIPSLERQRDRLVAGQALLVRPEGFARLQREGRVGEALLRHTGRLGNLERGELILTLVSEPPR